MTLKSQALLWCVSNLFTPLFRYCLVLLNSRIHTTCMQKVIQTFSIQQLQQQIQAYASLVSLMIVC